ARSAHASFVTSVRRSPGFCKASAVPDPETLMAHKYFAPSPAASPEDVETITELLSEPVIAFRRCLVDMAESLVGGLMLSQLLFLRNHAHARSRPDRRVYQTATDWELQIAASEYEQRGARKR